MRLRRVSGYEPCLAAEVYPRRHTKRHQGIDLVSFVPLRVSSWISSVLYVLVYQNRVAIRINNHKASRAGRVLVCF